MPPNAESQECLGKAELRSLIGPKASEVLEMFLYKSVYLSTYTELSFVQMSFAYVWNGIQA